MPKDKPRFNVFVDSMLYPSVTMTESNKGWIRLEGLKCHQRWTVRKAAITRKVKLTNPNVSGKV